MTPNQAHRLALMLAEWHGGQGSGLYAVSSTLLGSLQGRDIHSRKGWKEPVFSADVTIRAVKELSDLSRTEKGKRAQAQIRRMMDGVRELRTGVHVRPDPILLDDAIRDLVRYAEGGKAVTEAIIAATADDHRLNVNDLRAAWGVALNTNPALRRFGVTVSAPGRPARVLPVTEEWNPTPEELAEAKILRAEADALIIRTGDRVEIPVHSDWWMRGDRFGEVVGTTPGGTLRVKLDKSGQTVNVSAGYSRKV